MKPISFFMMNVILLLMLISSVVAFASPTVSAAPPVTLQFSLETPKTIVPGEPIIIKYTMANPTSQDVGVRQGWDDSEWLTFSMTNAHGDTAKVLPIAPYSHSASLDMRAVALWSLIRALTET